MTHEEKIAVAVFELRERGMHPEWIKWFAWVEHGRYAFGFVDGKFVIDTVHRVAPAPAHVEHMRLSGYTP